MSFPRTIGRILELAVSAVPDRLSVTLGDECLTFAQSRERATRMAHALAQLGLSRGDRVVYCGPTSLRTLDIFLATQLLGVAFAPIRHDLSLSESAAVVRYLQPALFIGDALSSEPLPAISQATDVPTAWVHGTGPGVDLEAAFSRASRQPVGVHVDDEDIHAIFLTSGSTGEPKGVMVSHRASWNRSFNGATRTPTCGGRGEINMFPLFHWAGWNFILVAWLHLRTIHLARSTDADSIAGLIDRWAPESMYAIPALWERLLGSKRSFERNSLRWARTGTYCFDPGLIGRIRECFPNATCTAAWGATELGTGAMISDSDLERKPGSIGLPAPGVELRLQDGELFGRTDQMMTGYFDLPDKTREVLADGWYRTGDLADKDEEGFLRIRGRRRDVIRSGGETIVPSEIEVALAGLPGVLELAVVGLPDSTWGEIVCAACVLEPGAALPSPGDVRQFVGDRLPRFKIPRLLRRVEALPRTPATGQVQRAQLVAMLGAKPE